MQPSSKQTPYATVLDVEHSTLGAHWRYRQPDERQVLLLQQQRGLSEILARIALGRGVTLESVEHYFAPSLRHYLPDPFHLKDMDKATARLSIAVQQDECIGIFGDYDVDGATSSALLACYFDSIGIASHIYIPDRQKEGYGPNIEGFRALKEKGCTLIITVDCGTVAYEPLEQAAEEGMEIIVLDHHTGAAKHPRAVAIVNPNRLDETSPCGTLAAVGVTFLTLVALNKNLRDANFFTSPTGRGRNSTAVSGEGDAQKDPHPNPLPEGEGKPIAEPNLLHYIDLVALGTVCDVVPLTGLNRAFVCQGLKVLSQRQNLGLRVLADSARMDGAAATYHLGFLLGPRINAGGRVGRAHLGSRLLMTQDEEEARAIALELERYNEERKAIEGLALEEAIEIAERQSNRSILLVGKEGWHEGVIGIIAGRLKERFERPVAVLSISGDKAKASARSVPGVDFGAAVISARESGLLIAGGGHAMAAGFTVATDKISQLHDFLEARLEKGASDFLADRHLSIDAVVRVGGLQLSLAEEMERAAPYGVGNPAPKLAVASARIVDLKQAGENHLMFKLADSEQKGPWVRAVAFRSIGQKLGDFLLTANNRPVHLAGTLKADEWQGVRRVTFHVEDGALAG